MLKRPADPSTSEINKTLNKRVQHEVVAHKSKLLECKIKKLEDDYVKMNSFNLFKTVRELENKAKKFLNIVLDKDGNKQASINKVLKIWKEHFEKHLNTEFPHKAAALDKIIVDMSDDFIEPNITKDDQGY